MAEQQIQESNLQARQKDLIQESSLQAMQKDLKSIMHFIKQGQEKTKAAWKVQLHFLNKFQSLLSKQVTASFPNKKYVEEYNTAFRVGLLQRMQRDRQAYSSELSIDRYVAYYCN